MKLKVMKDPLSFYCCCFGQIYQNGLREMNISFVLRKLVIPVTICLVSMVTVPYVAGNLFIPLLGKLVPLFVFHTITWLLCAFSLVVDHDLLKDTHRWRQITSADLFFFFRAPKSFNKPFEFLLYKTNKLHFLVCVYCNRSQRTSQRQ